MKKVTIYGERCSGTTYLEHLLVTNFNVQIVWDYGHKHFFGFNDLSNTDDVLFIGIIRNLEDWVNSLYREKYHLPDTLTNSVDDFLNNTFYSLTYIDITDNTDNTDKPTEIMEDRNIETNERYKNIFELRLVKNRYLVEKMPKIVKNYCLITYDDLISNFKDNMNKLRCYGLKVKNDLEFPLNVLFYKKNKTQIFKKKENEISKEKIENLISENKDLLFYENLLFPNSRF